MRHVRYRPVLVAACAVAPAVSGAATARAQQSRVVLADTSYQSAFGFTDVGPSGAGTAETVLIYLNVRDSAALAERVRSVSTPGSPDYDKFLTPRQVQDRNQLSAAQFEQVRRWLASAGLSYTQPNWREVSVTGTIGQRKARST